MTMINPRTIRRIAIIIAALISGMSCERAQKPVEHQCNSGDTVTSDTIDGPHLKIPVQIQKTVNLNVYYPNFTGIDTDNLI